MAKIAMPVTAGFKDAELTVPLSCLESFGHRVVFIGPRSGQTVEGKRGGTQVTIEAAASDVDRTDFDALVILGGRSPAHLRADSAVVEFVREFAHTGGAVAAICHGPQLLIEAGLVQGRSVTSSPSVRTDLENAGATWADLPVVTDENLITSRGPDDLEDFCEAVLKAL